MIGLPPVNAFVLQRTPYREDSWLLRLFTADRGQVTVHYRGGDPVYLYQPYHVEVQGSGDWLSCRGLEMAGPLLRLSGHHAYLALYLNELCGRLLPRWVNAEGLFGTYYATLKSLQAGEPAEPLLRFFERQLLAQLGYAIDFFEDTSGLVVDPGARYRFDGCNRFVADPNGLLSGHLLAAMARNRYDDPDVARAAKRIYRQALEHQLDHKPLASRALFQPTSARYPPQAGDEEGQ